MTEQEILKFKVGDIVYILNEWKPEDAIKHVKTYGNICNFISIITFIDYTDTSYGIEIDLSEKLANKFSRRHFIKSFPIHECRMATPEEIQLYYIQRDFPEDYEQMIKTLNK